MANCCSFKENDPIFAAYDAGVVVIIAAAAVAKVSFLGLAQSGKWLKSK